MPNSQEKNSQKKIMHTKTLDIRPNLFISEKPPSHEKKHRTERRKMGIIMFEDHHENLNKKKLNS